MTPPKGLLLVTMEPPAGLEEEFNDWYDTEHFPQRAALPGFESASRWVCLQGWPRWAALYDLASVAALETAEYLAVSGPRSTPWSRRILPRTTGRARVLAEQTMPGTALELPPASVARLVLACYKQPVDPEAANAAAMLPGLTQLRLFRTVGAPPAQGWAVAAFDRPPAPEQVLGAFGSLGGAGALLLNTYAPYRRG